MGWALPLALLLAQYEGDFTQEPQPPRQPKTPKPPK